MNRGRRDIMLRGYAINGLPERKSQRLALGLIACGLVILLLPAALCLFGVMGATGWLP